MAYKFLTICAFSLGMVWTQNSYSMMLTQKVTFQMEKSPERNVSSQNLRSALKTLETLKEYLLVYDVNEQDETGSTLLHHAASVGNFDVIKVLVSFGADKNLVNNVSWTPCRLAIFWFNTTNQLCYEKIAKFLNPEIPFFNDL